MLRDLEGVICLIDDILIYGNTQEEHDEQLLAVLNRLEEAGLTLNRDKCKFSWREVKFPGHILSQDGVCSDPDKVAAVVNMEEPMTVKELRRFLGMVNQLSKFMPHLAEMTKPERSVVEEKSVDVGPCSEISFFINKRCPHQESSFSVI